MESSRKKARHEHSSASVYVDGLKTYVACQQLERLCAQIGKVKRIKFYKNDHGGLKGDALIHFEWSRTIVDEAILRVCIFNYTYSSLSWSN